MNSKLEILQGLDEKYKNLFDWLEKQSVTKFSISPAEGKWTTGEHVDHLIKSTKPLNTALRLPKLQLRMMFGKPNREGRTYDELVTKYKEKLAGGGAASGRYLPKGITNDQKSKLITSLKNEQEKLKKALDKWSEKDLDKYLLPHPLLGKMTVREMMFFNAYHTEHHHNTLKDKYEQ